MINSIFNPWRWHQHGQWINCSYTTIPTLSAIDLTLWSGIGVTDIALAHKSYPRPCKCSFLRSQAGYDWFKAGLSFIEVSELGLIHHPFSKLTQMLQSLRPPLKPVRRNWWSTYMQASTHTFTMRVRQSHIIIYSTCTHQSTHKFMYVYVCTVPSGNSRLH